jgi:hypothetical protein
MSKKIKMFIKEEGEERVMELLEEDVEKEFEPTLDAETKGVSGYYKTDGHGHSEKFEPYFNVLTPQQIEIRTRWWGKVNLSIHFFNVTANHGGPSLSKEGGVVSLDAGYWRMYFLGSITSYPTASGLISNVVFTS